jgi:hypothetical protein
MGMMKIIFTEMMEQRKGKSPSGFKQNFSHHLLKDPGGLSQHVLINTIDDQIICSGTMTAIQKYLKMKKIPQHKVFNYYKYWDR